MKSPEAEDQQEQAEQQGGEKGNEYAKLFNEANPESARDTEMGPDALVDKMADIKATAEAAQKELLADARAAVEEAFSDGEPGSDEAKQQVASKVADELEERFNEASGAELSEVAAQAEQAEEDTERGSDRNESAGRSR